MGAKLEDWRQVHLDWQVRMLQTTAFGQSEYRAKWSELCEKIARTLPMDPASGPALQFLREGIALFEPHFRTVSPTLWPDLIRSTGSWAFEGAMNDTIKDTWNFLGDVAASAISRGEDLSSAGE